MLESIVENIVSSVRQVMNEPEAGLPLHIPVFGKNAESYVVECVRTGWVSSVGKFVDRFEEDLARYTGVKRAVAVVNGTAALHIAQLMVGVQPGDEVLIPSLTFVATANSVKYCNATPHFIDVCPKTLGVDPVKLDGYLSEIADVKEGVCINRNTGSPIRAIVGMHAFGHPFDIEGVQTVCAKFGLKFVEDAAESIGSYYKNQHTGGFGDVGIISFNGNKTITTGGGGALLTNDESLADRAKHITTTAKISHPYRYFHDTVAYNYRMPNINAALGCSQLEDIEALISCKRGIADRYLKAFESNEVCQIFKEPADCRSNYWLNALVLNPDFALKSGEIINLMHQHKVFVRPIWEPLHKLDIFAGCPQMDLSVTLDLGNRIINLPSTPSLD